MCNFGKPHAVPSSVFIIPRRGAFVKGSAIKKLDKIRQGLYTVPWKAAFASRFFLSIAYGRRLVSFSIFSIGFLKYRNESWKGGVTSWNTTS